MATAVVIQTIVLAITAIIVAVYTWEARQLRREAVDENTFSAIAEFTKHMSSRESYNRRSYLHTKDFCRDFLDIGNAVFAGCLSVDPEGKICLDESVISKELAKGHKTWRDFLEEFTDALRAKVSQEYNTNMLEALELTLSDFDIIALSQSLGIKSAKAAGRAYKSVFEATAPRLLPFVEFQRALRPDDPDYKKHYIDLLRSLK